MPRTTTPLRGALLGLIARGPSSGYDLAKLFAGTVGNVWGARHSAIYPELVAMQNQGLVKVSTVGKRGRKPYVLTRDGRAALQEWLLSEPRRSTPRHDALLRTFFLGLLEPADAARFVEQELRYHRDVLAAYEADAARYDEPVARGPAEPEWWTGGLTLELGIRVERTMIEWYEWVQQQLESAPIRPIAAP